ncbi:hypothetical protein RQP54_09020 [Curvibacter sp. APW13]|uniref:hypothetical protein n=1 Tax=Curvibacter sp. APW13 TaxID=3077236 RepID=UPI0028DE462F|nr:hypothetical protein [Curvibacter sp. APW13]MDT8991002.1 hypothetical protein [Curvibacter sp. APW13]
MAISLEWEPHGAVRIYNGTIHIDGIVDAIAQLQNDPRFDRLRYLIEDFSAVDSLAISESEVDLIVAHAIGAAYSNPHIRVAAVATSEQTRQLVRQFAKDSPYIVRLFGDTEAARQWISGGETSPVPLEIQLQASVEFEEGRPVR